MKFKDLEVGMVVQGNRSSPMLITENDSPSDNEFFEGKDNIKFLCANDSYHGQALRSVGEGETFTLIEGEERKDVLKIIFKDLINAQSDIGDSVSMVKIALFGDK